MFMVASSAVIVIVTFGLNKKGQLRWTFKGDKIFGNIYLNDYAEFDSKISYIMFLYEDLLACEISPKVI